MDKTPYELWYGSKPDLRHLHLFGSKVMVDVPNIDYGEDVKGNRVYNATKNTVIISRDVIVMEDETDVKEKSKESAIWIPNVETSAESQEEENGVTVGELSQNIPETEDSYDYFTDASVSVEGKETLTETPTHGIPEHAIQATSTPKKEVADVQAIRMSNRDRKQPDRYGFNNIYVFLVLFQQLRRLCSQRLLWGQRVSSGNVQWLRSFSRLRTTMHGSSLIIQVMSQL